MAAMKPVVGMECAYYNEKCSLKVEIISYEEMTNKELFSLKVLKNLSPNSGCPYKEDQVFPFERDKNSAGNGLEGLILDP